MTLFYIVIFSDYDVIVALSHDGMIIVTIIVLVNWLLQGSESGADSGGTSSTAVVDLEIKMEDLRQALRKAQVFD